MRALGLSTYRDYLEYLLADAGGPETTKFVNALTTNKTEFFRESHHFEFLTNKVFPELVKAAETSGSKKMRIWCSASSTGEEPYTIAMTTCEYFNLRKGWDIRILASDIDTDVLHAASEGIYDASRMQDIPVALRKRYFTRTQRSDEGPWKANPSIRDLITFRQINLLKPDWPIHSTFDVIFCRNVMIYFDAANQSKLVDQFADKLTPNGYLIIGHSESLLGLTDRYKSLGDTIYRCTAAGSKASKAELPPKSSASSSVQPIPSVEKEQEVKIPSANKVASRVRPRTPVRSSMELHGEPVSRIIVGEVKASEKPMWISTLLGSCVAVCLFDEVKKIGGMNHFMLPDSNLNNMISASYGIHAMELLINAIMQLGGDARRLKAKLFGGCVVSQDSSRSLNVGRKNIDFALEFLERESIPWLLATLAANVECGSIFTRTQAKYFFDRWIRKLLCNWIDEKDKKQSRSHRRHCITATLLSSNRST